MRPQFLNAKNDAISNTRKRLNNIFADHFPNLLPPCPTVRKFAISCWDQTTRNRSFRQASQELFKLICGSTGSDLLFRNDRFRAVKMLRIS